MAYIGRELRQDQAVRSQFTALGAETSVNVSYTAGQLTVFLNGIKLLDGTDFTGTTGTNIDLASALATDDVLDFIAYDTFSVADVVPASTGGTFAGAVFVPAPTQDTHASTKKYVDDNAGGGGGGGGNLGSVAENILPDTDDTRDLGSAAKRWANIYSADLHLANERGDWTVVEEENYLTLRNNKTDKVYKLVMEEIE
tara:strand:- start:51 stop:644 length:594 start_codon:yes stop_codon:yes gene_type:complete